MSRVGFSGTYHPEDVTFLLKPVAMEFTAIADKERAIQSGRRHYSEMLSRETAPTKAYMQVFRRAFDLNRARVGRDVAALARSLACSAEREVVLVSLARAGTPLGVLLVRSLRRLGVAAVHYSVSIIRGRGIDLMAMSHILMSHRAADVVFVDGWTGKGAITKELRRTLGGSLPQLGAAPLCVLSDLAGLADIAAGADDYVIPSAILNGVISGLVSRTVLADGLVGPRDFHGCVLLDDLASHDISHWYIEQQMVDVAAALSTVEPVTWAGAAKEAAAARSRAFIEHVLERTGIADINRVKPGIGEATRALLRREPERLFLRDEMGEDTRHLKALAVERGVVPEIDPLLPYRACVVIRTLGAG